ncbi:MAG: glycosyltransferase [Acidobacteria bacterium]|nr:glycosyltransferase [Acidobacteriota bacterium]
MTQTQRSDAVHTFSVVIATRNRAALLAQTLEALLVQDWPAGRFEIVVADNGSSDDTADVVARAAAQVGAPLVRYLFVSDPGKSAAVNQALAMAEGSLIALTDDDVQPEQEWLRSLADAFDDAAVDFVAGRVLPLWEVEPPEWLSPSVYGVIAVPDNGDVRLPISTDHHQVVPIGANMAVRRAVVERLGGLRLDLGKLDGSARTGEDHEFFLRMLQAGYRGRYEPTAVVHHRVGSERLDRSYFRRWLHQNGRDVARLDAAYESAVPHLLGVPRFLWRQAAGDVMSLLLAAIRRAPAARFSATGRLCWFAGYVREAWFATERLRAARAAAPRPFVSEAN